MKKIRFMLLALATVASLTLAACSKDDDQNANKDNNTENQGGNGNENGGGRNGGNEYGGFSLNDLAVSDFQVDESETAIVANFKSEYNGQPVDVKMTFIHDETTGQCSNAVVEVFFATEAEATAAYNAMTAEAGESASTISRRDNTIVMDLTSQFVGKTKSEIRTILAVISKGQWQYEGDDEGGEVEFGILPDAMAIFTGDVTEGENMSGSARLMIMPIEDSYMEMGGNGTITYTFSFDMELHDYDTDETYADSYSGNVELNNMTGIGRTSDFISVQGRYADDYADVSFTIHVATDEAVVTFFKGDKTYDYILQKTVVFEGL